MWKNVSNDRILSVSVFKRQQNVSKCHRISFKIFLNYPNAVTDNFSQSSEFLRFYGHRLQVYWSICCQTVPLVSYKKSWTYIFSLSVLSFFYRMVYKEKIIKKIWWKFLEIFDECSVCLKYFLWIFWKNILHL